MYTKMPGLYFVTLHDKIFTTRVRSQTCLLGFSNRTQAHRAKTALNQSQHVGKIPAVVAEVDIMDEDFYKMLKENQFKLMVANEIDFHESGSFGVGGDVVEPPELSHQDAVMYFEKLVRK